MTRAIGGATTILSLVTGWADPANWISWAADLTSRITAAVTTPGDDMDKAAAFFGVSPTGQSQNPQSVFVCDCVLMCQILYLQPPITADKWKKFAGCTAVRGGPWKIPEIPGQQGSLMQFVRTLYPPAYLQSWKDAGTKMQVSQQDTPMRIVKAMLMAIDPATFTDRILAQPKMFSCAMLHPGF